MNTPQKVARPAEDYRVLPARIRPDEFVEVKAEVRAPFDPSNATDPDMRQAIAATVI